MPRKEDDDDATSWGWMYQFGIAQERGTPQTRQVQILTRTLNEEVRAWRGLWGPATDTWRAEALLWDEAERSAMTRSRARKSSVTVSATVLKSGVGWTKECSEEERPNGKRL